MPAFSKAAGCRAEPYGLNRRSRRKKCSGRGARCAADSPGSGRGGTALAPSTSKTPGRGGTPRGGHPSPLFLKYGKAVASGLGCRLGCCLPVADAQHRPKWQRRPLLNGAHRAPGPPAPLLLACRLGRPLGNVPPGRSGPLKRWTKLLLVSTQLAWRDPPLRNARRRLVLSGHGPRARAFGPASLRKPRRPKAACATCPVRSRTA